MSTLICEGSLTYNIMNNSKNPLLFNFVRNPCQAKCTRRFMLLSDTTILCSSFVDNFQKFQLQFMIYVKRVIYTINE